MTEGPKAPRVLDPTILRENDIRGIVGETLFVEDAYAIGLAFGSLLIEQGGKTAALGYDGRLSSPALEAALADGLCASGVDLWRVGMGPSPMLYYATHTLKADAGLMVTGSHNPATYNGIKMSMFGRPFFMDHIQQLGDRAARGGFTQGTGSSKAFDIQADYVERLLADYRGKRHMTVAWDPGNGAAGNALVELTKKLPGTHYLINETVDGTFPAHHPDPTVEANLVQLKQLVADKGCDLGIGFDGDADRIGIVDSQGRVLWGDQLLCVLAEEVLKAFPGAPVITDIKASQLFADEILRMGGQPVFWNVGHAHIKTKMIEMNAPLAGEMSAHIFFNDRYYGYDDALYAAVRLLSLLASGDRSLADIHDSLPVYHNTPELRLDCPEDRKFVIIDEVRQRLAADRDAGEVNAIDGVRVETEQGWWLLRASNTQAAVTARCESPTESGLSRMKQDLVRQLKLSGLDAPDF